MGTIRKRVPELRFEGFHAEWKEKLIAEVLKIKNGKSQKDIANENGKYPILATGGIIGRTDTPIYEQESVLIGRKGTIDKPYYMNTPFWSVDTLFYSELFKEVNGIYMYMLFQTIPWRDYDTSTGVPSLTGKTIESMQIYVPILQEQTLIGNFFKQLDEVIHLLEEELGKYKNLKKAYLAKMFPKEGEKVPELRFPGFSGEWEEKKLGEVARFINGRAYKQEELLKNGKYKVLRVGNFYTNDSWYYSDLELEEKYFANIGDLLYTWSATFGPHIWNGDKVIYHYHIWKIELTSLAKKEFFVQLLDYDKEKILSNKNGSTMVHITKSGIEEKRVSMPLSIKEQTLIGNFFKEMDETIELKAQELEKYKDLKRAYLAKMFV